jgi:hypothetical protein
MCDFMDKNSQDTCHCLDGRPSLLLDPCLFIQPVSNWHVHGSISLCTGPIVRPGCIPTYAGAPLGHIQQGTPQRIESMKYINTTRTQPFMELRSPSLPGAHSKLNRFRQKIPILRKKKPYMRSNHETPWKPVMHTWVSGEFEELFEGDSWRHLIAFYQQE